jgi:hypothetical protein
MLPLIKNIQYRLLRTPCRSIDILIDLHAETIVLVISKSATFILGCLKCLINETLLLNLVPRICNGKQQNISNDLSNLQSDVTIALHYVFRIFSSYDSFTVLKGTFLPR